MEESTGNRGKNQVILKEQAAIFQAGGSSAENVSQIEEERCSVKEIENRLENFGR